MKDYKRFKFYPIKWEYDTLSRDETEAGLKPESYNIRIYGLTEKDESVCVFVEGFTPYIYISLPSQDVKGKPIRWTDEKLSQVDNYLRHKLVPYPEDNERAYRWNLDVEQIRHVKLKTMCKYTKESQNLFLVTFWNHEHTKSVRSRLSREQEIRSIGYTIKFEVYEYWIDPLVKFYARNNNMSPSMWKEVIKGKSPEEKTTSCKYEIICQWNKIRDISYDKIVHPMILTFDIETYSSRWNIKGVGSSAFPDVEIEKDEVYMISCTFHRYLSDRYNRYLICNKACNDPSEHDRKIELVSVNTEVEVLNKFKELIHKYDPDILIGHNILGYDLQYMAYRSGCPIRKGNQLQKYPLEWLSKRKQNIWGSFSELGKLKYKKCKLIENSWSSSAYKGMNFKYIDINGRLLIDTMPYIRRTQPTLENVKLEFVSQKFLGEGKNPIDYQEQFSIYDTNDPVRMTHVAKYCVQDAELCLKLMYKLNIWIDLNEISNVVGLPIFDLYTRGQSVRGVSQVYRRIFKEYVMDFAEPDDKSDEEKTTEKFQGAYVVDPKPGVYRNVICMDFSSLYPSIIRAHNLDYTTYVPEDDYTIPDSMCNIIEWDENPKKNGIETIHYRYRFIKPEYHKGILPLILDDFTNARSIAKKEMEKHMVPDTDGQPLKGHEIEFASSNSKQKELKVSSNSIYGLMGFRKGRMGLLPGAMSTTALGRQSIQKVIDHINTKYVDVGATLVYGDTDSAMFTFKNWNFYTSFCNGPKLADEITEMFPPPMKIAFEKIFDVFLILTKKRYAGYICNEKREIKQFMKKGLILARRNYCKFSKDIYTEVLKLYMDNTYNDKFKQDSDKQRVYNDVMALIFDKIKLLMSGQVPLDDLKIRNTWNPTVVKTFKTDYGEIEYLTYKQPQAHDVLVHKLLDLGFDIKSGDIIYYVFVENSGKTRQVDLVQDPELHLKDKNSKINYIYYLNHQIINNLSELVQVGSGSNITINWSLHKSKPWRYGRLENITFNPRNQLFTNKDLLKYEKIKQNRSIIKSKYVSHSDYIRSPSTIDVKNSVANMIEDHWKFSIAMQELKTLFSYKTVQNLNWLESHSIYEILSFS